MRAMREPEEEALRPVLRAELTKAIDELPEEFRVALVLCDVEELSYKEIADAFEITEQAARKRMFDALEKIRKLLVNKRSDFFESR